MIGFLTRKRLGLLFLLVVVEGQLGERATNNPRRVRAFLLWRFFFGFHSSLSDSAVSYDSLLSLPFSTSSSFISQGIVWTFRLKPSHTPASIVIHQGFPHASSSRATHIAGDRRRHQTAARLLRISTNQGSDCLADSRALLTFFGSKTCVRLVGPKLRRRMRFAQKNGQRWLQSHLSKPDTLPLSST